MLYQHPDLYDALLPVSHTQLRFYAALAQRCAGAVLELGCGTGQPIVPIAAAGAPAAGLDASPEMLAAARRRADAAGVQVDLVEGDMRKFDLGRQCSLIFIARNSLLHLSEPHEFAALFDAVRGHLSPEGVLAFDIFTPDLRRRSLQGTERVPIMRVMSPVHGEITIEETSDYSGGAFTSASRLQVCRCRLA